VLVYRLAQECTTSSVTDTGRNKRHPLPFWAEAQCRLTYIDCVFKYGYNENHERFICSLPKYKAFFDSAEFALGRLQYLIDNGGIHDVRPRITKQKIIREKFHIFRQVGFKRTNNLQQMSEFFYQVPNEIPIDVWCMLRYASAFDHPKEWKLLENMELRFIVEETSRRLIEGSGKSIRSNTISLITALIYLAKEGNPHPKYDLAYVTSRADAMLEETKDDVEGHFLRGVFDFVTGIQQSNISTVDRARKSFDTCYELYDRNEKQIPGYMTYKFVILNSSGIAAIYPLDGMKSRDIELVANKRTFEGREIPDGRNECRKVGVRVCGCENVVRAVIDRQCRVPDTSQQSCLLNFNLVLRKGGFVAVNVKRAEI
jgi:hypothetical protein